MKILRALLLAAPFALSACGEGYEVVKTDTIFPYGNQRTAGSGYAYVLAKMLPEKEMNLKPVVAPREPEAVEETKKIVDGLDKTFKDAQKK